MSQEKILDKVKGYLKLGGLTAGAATVMPSITDKEKSSGTDKNKKES